jgi:hypothetical protein
MNLISLSPIVVALLVAAPGVSSAQSCFSAPSAGGRGETQHLSSHRRDDRYERLVVRWERGDCELRVDARGTFTARADLAAITSVEEGGYVEIEETYRDRERKVRITNDGSGLQFRWTVDGRTGFDVDKERWLADALIALERRTAMFAKTRVPELIRRGGPKAVLDETDGMESDYARKTYYAILLQSTRVDESSLERIMRQTGEGMSSDYERAEVLRAVAKHGGMTDRITRAAIAVAQRMSSDYEKRRALSAGLESVNTIEARNALFTAASTMSSNYELAELLIAAQGRSMVDSLSRATYFRAVQRLSSDYEQRRTLSALLKQRPESPAVLADVLRSSENIQSDYELASLLVEFSKTINVRGELRELYLRAARSIGSDHEYRRALQALLEQDRRT